MGCLRPLGLTTIWYRCQCVDADHVQYGQTNLLLPMISEFQTHSRRAGLALHWRACLLAMVKSIFSRARIVQLLCDDDFRLVPGLASTPSAADTDRDSDDDTSCTPVVYDTGSFVVLKQSRNQTGNQCSRLQRRPLCGIVASTASSRAVQGDTTPFVSQASHRCNTERS